MQEDCTRDTSGYITALLHASEKYDVDKKKIGANIKRHVDRTTRTDFSVKKALNN